MPGCNFTKALGARFSWKANMKSFRNRPHLWVQETTIACVNFEARTSYLSWFICQLIFNTLWCDFFCQYSFVYQVWYFIQDYFDNWWMANKSCFLWFKKLKEMTYRFLTLNVISPETPSMPWGREVLSYSNKNEIFDIFL